MLKFFFDSNSEKEYKNNKHKNDTSTDDLNKNESAEEGEKSPPPPKKRKTTTKKKVTTCPFLTLSQSTSKEPWSDNLKLLNELIPVDSLYYLSTGLNIDSNTIDIYSYDYSIDEAMYSVMEMFPLSIFGLHLKMEQIMVSLITQKYSEDFDTREVFHSFLGDTLTHYFTELNENVKDFHEIKLEIYYASISFLMTRCFNILITHCFDQISQLDFNENESLSTIVSGLFDIESNVKFEYDYDFHNPQELTDNSIFPVCVALSPDSYVYYQKWFERNGNFENFKFEEHIVEGIGCDPLMFAKGCILNKHAKSLKSLIEFNKFAAGECITHFEEAIESSGIKNIFLKTFLFMVVFKHLFKTGNAISELKKFHMNVNDEEFIEINSKNLSYENAIGTIFMITYLLYCI